MMGSLKVLFNKHRHDFWQMGKFGIVGGLNTLVDFGVFSLLYYAADVYYLTAQVIAYATATCHSYLWNRYWTFQAKHKPHVAEFTKFVLVNIISLGVSLVIIFLGREQAGLSTLISKIIATFFAMVVNFSLNRFWVFRVGNR
jgi:putative flippase GtrA